MTSAALHPRDEARQALLANPAVDVALLVAPGLPSALAGELQAAVRDHLERLGIAGRASVVVAEEPALGRPAPTMELVDMVRRRLVVEGWDLAIGITDVPLRLARRLVAGHASPVHGVALLSLPALGPTRTAHRARQAVTHLIDEVLGEDFAAVNSAARASRLGRRLIALRDVGDSPGGLGVVIAGGYLRLLWSGPISRGALLLGFPAPSSPPLQRSSSRL